MESHFIIHQYLENDIIFCNLFTCKNETNDILLNGIINGIINEIKKIVAGELIDIKIVRR